MIVFNLRLSFEVESGKVMGQKKLKAWNVLIACRHVGILPLDVFTGFLEEGTTTLLVSVEMASLDELN